MSLLLVGNVDGKRVRERADGRSTIYKLHSTFLETIGIYRSCEHVHVILNVHSVLFK